MDLNVEDTIQQDISSIIETTEKSNEYVISREKFRIFTNCIGLLETLNCSDCDMKSGLIRQVTNIKNIIISMNMESVIGKRDFYIKNIKDKHSVLKSLDVDDSIEWSKKDMTIKDDTNYYLITDPFSSITLKKPVRDMMDNKFVDDTFIKEKMNINDDNRVFSYKINSHISTRIKSICDSIKTDSFICKFEDDIAKIYIRSKGKNDDLSAEVIKDITIDRKVIPVGSSFVLTSMPFNVYSTSDIQFNFYRTPSKYICEFKKTIFNSIDLAIYCNVALNDN